MPLSDIVSVAISLNTTPISEAGFGIPLILSMSAAWAERTRSYTSAAAVALDFATTTPEYLAAAAMFAQNPAPARVMIGRRANKSTMAWRIVPTAVDSKKYRVVVDGANADYTSDGTALVSEITAQLKVAIDALGKAVTTTDNGTSLDVVANVAGAWHSVVPDESAANMPHGSLMSITMTHADPGLATDLTAIAAENSDWYAVCNPANSALEAAAIAGWVESNSKFFMCGSQDTPIIAQGLTGSDIAQTLRTAADVRTAVFYHHNPRQFADAAWLGAVLPKDPGSENWMFATLAGVSATPLTGTHVTNAQAKNANYYYSVGSKNITAQGKVAGNQYIDVIRGRDWMVARLQSRYFSVMSGPKRLPYTDRGIGVLEGETRAQMEEGIRQGFIAEDPKYVVAATRASAQSSTDKTNRAYKGLSFEATIQGAIDTLNVAGVLSA